MDEMEVKSSTTVKVASVINMESDLDQGSLEGNSNDTTQGIDIIEESFISTTLLENLTITFSEQEKRRAKHYCTIYKRLTKICNCLNQTAYNDLMIHFNEGSKYESRSDGEIIKNLRILKKFLYMGGGYCKNALMFLEEGLQTSLHDELKEIIVGCTRADICNVFEGPSLAIQCIYLPCKYPVHGDSKTQALAAMVLFKMAEVEEGRQYLNSNTKITSNLRKIIRKQGNVLEFDTLLTLNVTLNFLRPLPNDLPNIVPFSNEPREDKEPNVIEKNEEPETKICSPNESLKTCQSQK